MADETVRNYYRQWFRDRLNQMFENRSRTPAQGGFGRPGGYRKPGSPFSTPDPNRADVETHAGAATRSPRR